MNARLYKEDFYYAFIAFGFGIMAYAILKIR